MPQEIVHRRQVEIHLARVFGLEAIELEVNDNEAAKSKMIEEQIKAKVLASHFKPILAADKREAYAEFQ